MTIHGQAGPDHGQHFGKCEEGVRKSGMKFRILNIPAYRQAGPPPPDNKKHLASLSIPRLRLPLLERMGPGRLKCSSFK